MSTTTIVWCDQPGCGRNTQAPCPPGWERSFTVDGTVFTPMVEPPRDYCPHHRPKSAA